jgi:hypothetical protein
MAAAVLISMAVYMKRGYQGQVRGLGDQVASQYSPSTAVINNREVKRIRSTVVSKSDTAAYTREDTDEVVNKAISENMGSYANESWN